MITDPRSSLAETKSSRKESIFPAEMTLIKSVGTANRQSPPTPRKFVALYHRNTKIRMRSDKRDQHDEYDYEINEDKIITLKYTAYAVAKRSRDSYKYIPHFIFILLQLLGYVMD